MPDSNIPLQPEEPRAQRPTYQRPTYQQPPFRQSPYGTPSQRRGWSSFGCIPTLLILLLLLCCVCNPLNTLFSTSTYDTGQPGMSPDQLLYGY